MATFTELYDIQANAGLRNRIAVAAVVVADGIRTEDPLTPNHDKRLAWARDVFDNPDAVAGKLMWPVLAANKAFTTSQILGASDVAVQTAVTAAVSSFAF